VEVKITKPCKIRPKDEEEKIEAEPGRIYDLPENQGKSVVNAGYGEEVETEEVPDMTEEAEEVEELGGPEEEEAEEEPKVREDWVKFLVSRGFSRSAEENIYSKELEGGRKLVVDFEQDPQGRRFGYDEEGKSSRELREHPDLAAFKALRDGDVGSPEDAVTMAEREIRAIEEEKEPEEKAEEVGEAVEVEAGEGRVQELRMEPALELSGEQSTNLLEKMLLKGLDVEDLKRLVWDPDANPREVPYDPEQLPYQDIEPTAEAYDLFARIVEIATGVTYDVEEVDFHEDEEKGTVNCDVLIVREPDGKRMPGHKTREKEALAGMDHWRERLYTKARRNALKPDIPPTWLNRLLREYREKCRPKVRK